MRSSGLLPATRCFDPAALYARTCHAIQPCHPACARTWALQVGVCTVWRCSGVSMPHSLAIQPVLLSGHSRLGCALCGGAAVRACMQLWRLTGAAGSPFC
eukprot:1151444-Pelagomonas_calceolata.AAC.4